MLLAASAIPGAHAGAGMAIRASDQRLRVVVAGMIGLVAISYAVGEIVVLAGV